MQFRVIDQSTGVAREVLLTDHKSIEMKLQSQRADMERIEKHIVTLRQSVSPPPLHAQRTHPERLHL